MLIKGPKSPNLIRRGWRWRSGQISPCKIRLQIPMTDWGKDLSKDYHAAALRLPSDFEMQTTCNRSERNSGHAHRYLGLFRERTERRILRWSRRKMRTVERTLCAKINSGMLRVIQKQRDVSPMSADSLALEAPLVASPNQTMRAIQVSRKKLYELINSGELEATQKASRAGSRSNRSTNTSSADWPRRRLAEVALRPIQSIDHVLKREARSAVASRSTMRRT